MKRIGFACKYMHSDQSLKKKILEEIQRPYNTKATTHSWLIKQSSSIAYQKLEYVIDHNLKSLFNLIEYVGSLDEQLRMVRISSDILPFYTHPVWKDFYTERAKQGYAESFAELRTLIDKYNIKVSYHPGQFTVLASDKPDVVTRSIEEFEYHVDMARWMGYGNNFQDGCKINVHIGGRLGPEGIRAALKKLSREAKNLITIENEEITWGLDDTLKLADDCALVLDVHHHWIKTGEYIQPDDPRVQKVINSWRGIRPTMHYSVSPESVLVGHPTDQLPDLNKLLKQGYKKAKLRAHSDYYWNSAANQWALSFRDQFDIMCESKCKNLASIKLLDLQSSI